MQFIDRRVYLNYNFFFFKRNQTEFLNFLLKSDNIFKHEMIDIH